MFHPFQESFLPYGNDSRQTEAVGSPLAVVVNVELARSLRRRTYSHR